MFPLIAALIVFVTLAVAIFSFAAAAYAPSSVLGARLRSLGVERQTAPRGPSMRDRLDQILDPLSKSLTLSPSDVSRTRTWLIHAGFRERRHLLIYSASRVFAAVALFAVAVAITGFQSVMVLAGAAAFGFFLPRLILKRLIRKRQHLITVGLPDALDLTVVCVEAGLPLDQALTRVGEDLKHAHPALSEEFYLANLEMRAGKPRAEALRNLAARTGVDDIRSLVASLIQTDRFGTSIVQALRVYSDSLRTERRQRAEEQASKTAVKMVIPLVVFVLPSLIFVTLGPALIELFRNLAPTVRR
jgi:tight adherence protein C